MDICALLNCYATCEEQLAMTQAQHALAAIEAYAASQPGEDVRANPLPPGEGTWGMAKKAV